MYVKYVHHATAICRTGLVMPLKIQNRISGHNTTPATIIAML